MLLGYLLLLFHYLHVESAVDEKGGPNTANGPQYHELTIGDLGEILTVEHIAKFGEDAPVVKKIINVKIMSAIFNDDVLTVREILGRYGSKHADNTLRDSDRPLVAVALMYDRLEILKLLRAKTRL